MKKAVALGFFDGVHIGHQALLFRLREEQGLLRTVYTFENHPLSLFEPEAAPRFLSSAAEKRELLLASGAQEVLMPRFDMLLASTDAQDFADALFCELNAACVIAGENFRFGRGAKGDAKLLSRSAKQFGARAVIVSSVDYMGEAVSSTRIRAALCAGDVSLAGAMLGREYAVSGTVVSGRQIGRSIGFPTANIALGEADTNRALPGDGVYECAAGFGEVTFPAVVNVGTNPTVGGAARTIEAHLLGFSGDLYEKRLTVCFKRKIRDEAKFPSIEALKAQIASDIMSIK